MKQFLFFSMAFLLSAVAYGQKKGKWVNLFDGKTTNGWHSWQSNEVKGWHVMNGVLMTHGKNGDLISDKEYGDFDLTFEFNVSPKGNSGIIYKVIESPDTKTYFASYASGPEYQVIDDANYPQAITDKQKTGANYDMIAPSTLTAVKPAGQWNKGRIVIKNNVVQHYLNGKKVVEYVYGSDDWKKMVAASKFANWPYATPHQKGRIALQDHNDMVSYRKIRIREL